MNKSINLNFWFHYLKKYEVIIASTIVILGVILMVYYIVMPNFSKANDISVQIKNLRTHLTAVKKKDNIISSIDFPKYSNSLSKVYRVMPLSKDYVSFFLRFDELQSKTGITLLGTNFQLGVISTESAFLKRTFDSEAISIPVSLSVYGNYQQTDDFLKALADLSGRLMVMDNVNWIFEKDNIKASYTGNSYYNPIVKTIIPINFPITIIDKNKEDLLSKIISSQVGIIEDDTKVENIKVGKKNLFN